MVYRNACNSMETKRLDMKAPHKFEKRSSAKPYFRNKFKAETKNELKRYAIAYC